MDPLQKFLIRFKKRGSENITHTIIPGSKTYTPAYLIYSNYEKILNWNRSLRFALAVCTLKDHFKNEI